MRTRRLPRYYGSAAAAASSTQLAPYTLPARYSPLPPRSQYSGINLNSVYYGNSNLPFSNALKSGTSFYWAGGPSVAGDPSNGLTLDADGWPTSLSAGQNARAQVLPPGANFPSGQYAVLWDGEGTISFPLSNVAVNSSVPGRITLTPTRTDTAVFLQINTINAANPIRNIRFLLPGTESTYASQPFNPMFLDRIAPFGVLRFMDWGKTNDTLMSEWAQRAVPSTVTYGGAAGVPIEVMIDLANRMHAHPWICIPQRASNDYAAQLATLLHANLDPTLRPRIEYSNECWNFGFGSYHWMGDQSDALGLSRPYGMPSRFYIKRAIELWNVMRGVYGADANRIVRVLGGQATWTQFLSDATSQPGTAGNYDAIAIAPYLQAQDLSLTANLPGSLSTTPDQVMDQMFTCLRGQATSSITQHAALAASLGVSLLGYESGKSNLSSYFPNDSQDPMLQVIKAGYTSPRMNALMVEYYTLWKNAGGTGALNQFTDIGQWTKFGCWPLLQTVTEDPAACPTYQGIMSFIAANP